MGLENQAGMPRKRDLASEASKAAFQAPAPVMDAANRVVGSGPDMLRTNVVDFLGLPDNQQEVLARRHVLGDQPSFEELGKERKTTRQATQSLASRGVEALFDGSRVTNRQRFAVKKAIVEKAKVDGKFQLLSHQVKRTLNMVYAANAEEYAYEDVARRLHKRVGTVRFQERAGMILLTQEQVVKGRGRKRQEYRKLVKDAREAGLLGILSKTERAVVEAKFPATDRRIPSDKTIALNIGKSVRTVKVSRSSGVRKLAFSLGRGEDLGFKNEKPISERRVLAEFINGGKISKIARANSTDSRIIEDIVRKKLVAALR